MPHPSHTPRLLHSLWDRLTNPELIRGKNVGVSPSGEIERLKGEVCRDLKWLLNTRTAPLEIPEGLGELHRSLVRFGLPDFSSLNYGDSRARDRLAGILESVIRNFEPRLDKVEVEVDEHDQHKSRSMIHYRIRAKLKVEPIPQPVAFDTVLELGNKTFVIKDEGG